MERNIFVQDPGGEHVLTVVAAILTPGIIDRAFAFIVREGREPTVEEADQMRRATVSEWIATRATIRDMAIRLDP